MLEHFFNYEIKLNGFKYIPFDNNIPSFSFKNQVKKMMENER